MAELTEKERTIIQETHDIVIEIKTVLLGANGDEGLVGDFQYLRKAHNKLSRSFYILIGVLLGSGILVGGITGLFHL